MVNYEDSTDKQVLMLKEWKPTGRNACWNIIITKPVKPAGGCLDLRLFLYILKAHMEAGITYWGK